MPSPFPLTHYCFMRLLLLLIAAIVPQIRAIGAGGDPLTSHSLLHSFSASSAASSSSAAFGRSSQLRRSHLPHSFKSPQSADPLVLNRFESLKIAADGERRTLEPVLADGKRPERQKKRGGWTPEGDYFPDDSLGEQHFTIRKASASDIQQLHDLYTKDDAIKSTSSTMNAKVVVSRMAEDFKRGRMHALVADLGGIVVAYALYYYTGSSHQGGGEKIIHLEDLYTAPIYRGIDLGSQLLLGLAEKAERSNVVNIEYAVPRGKEEVNQANVFNRLVGVQELTQAMRGLQEEYWLLPAEAFQHVIDTNAKDNDMIVKPESAIVDAKRAEELAERWSQMTVQIKRKQKVLKLTQLLHDGVLCVVTVTKPSLPDKVVGMALYHCHGHASWTGQYIWMDSIVAEHKHEHAVVTAVLAHLVKEAKGINANRVEWTAEDRVTASCASIFKKLGAIDMIEKEGGYLLYRWDFRKHLEKMRLKGAL